MERNTIQKEIILDVVTNMKGHATANEIYEKITKDYPTIGKSTVFRNLDRFAEQGIIAKRPVPNGPTVYDPIYTDHYHLKCTECEEIFDVDMDFISDLESKIKDTRGFLFTGHQIIFSGVCPSCRDKMGKE